MQKDCDTQNFDFHQRKNDLKWYQEAYIKYKATMRKWGYKYLLRVLFLCGFL